ncbi:hypothetical protein LIER_15394 [Lithospermum erythrorhizon]|uniref:Uncharacterized protein n=1 Tax=Lithospermum erythrorhizon TaxID=34254 RepID=A0AAV3Q7Z1_LITER
MLPNINTTESLPKKSDDIGESFELKRKLNKEETEAKIARKAERRAKRAAEKAVDVDVHEEAEDHVPEKVKEDILTAADKEGPFPGVITISPKLMQGTYVTDIPLAHVDVGGASGSSTDGTVQLLRDEPDWGCGSSC